VPGAVVDLEHPWLGLESFSEATRAYFFGRDAEIDELHLRLRSHPLLVVYGRSGLGKTSILTAGLVPRLRRERQNPVLLRLRFDDPQFDPINQIVAGIFGRAKSRRVVFTRRRTSRNRFNGSSASSRSSESRYRPIRLPDCGCVCTMFVIGRSSRTCFSISSRRSSR
jgi:hypothetical protein